MQTLSKEEAQSLTSEVSEDVLTAMGQLVSSLLIEMNVPIADGSAAITAPVTRLRELLITQLVQVHTRFACAYTYLPRVRMHACGPSPGGSSTWICTHTHTHTHTHI